MSKIVLEDFNEGNGYYKVNLAYLNMEQVEEIETLVSTWKPTDEDIKSCIQMCLTDANEHRFKDYGTNLKDCLAWLDKVKENICQNQLPDECLYDEAVSDNKIKPKFKVGDFIANDYCFGKVIEITNDVYLLDTEQGIPFSYEHNAHIWTIQDAKTGDVLALSYASQNYILIYKGLYKNMMSVFCSYCIEDDTYYDGTDSFHVMNCGEIITPATKEQRELLLVKMKDAGYEWDAEKKELKKIEQKIKWSKEDDANKIEPKFHEGNWYQCTKDFMGKGVTFDKNTAYYCAKEGCLQDEYGCHIAIVKNLYDNFKLWTIKDAKDGDILVSHHDIPFIYNGNYNSDYVGAYCGITTGGDFNVSTEKCQWSFNKNVHPATKEQRELLYKKMMESWEMWNSKGKNIIGENINYIWHSALEEPDEQREILVEYEREDITKHEVVYHYEVVYYHKDTDSFWKNSFIINDVTKWCYLDELIKHIKANSLC